MTRNKLRDRLDAITLKNIATTTQVNGSINNFERKHESEMRREVGRFCAQTELYHATIMGILHNLNYIEKDFKPYKSLQFMIAVNNQKSLVSAYRLLKSGMYDDALVVMRVAYESFLRIIFINLNQDHPYNAVIYAPDEGAKFNVKSLVEEQLKLSWSHYSILSSFAHGNLYRISIDRNAHLNAEEPQPITVKYEVEKDMISLCTNYLSFLTLATLWLAVEHLRPTDEQISANKRLLELYKTADECKELLYTTLLNHPNGEVWSVAASDLANIFKLLKITSKETDKDWKSKWKAITKQ